MAVRVIIRPTPVKATSKERLLDKIMLRDIYSFENRFNAHGTILFGRNGGKYADNHHYGAAARIRFFLEHGGIPVDFHVTNLHGDVRDILALYAPYRKK